MKMSDLFDGNFIEDFFEENETLVDLTEMESMRQAIMDEYFPSEEDLLDFSGFDTGVIVDLVEDMQITPAGTEWFEDGIACLVGSAADDILRGDDQGNTFFGNLGNDVFNGRGGIDQAIFSGRLADYEIIGEGMNFMVNHLLPDDSGLGDGTSVGADGNNTLTEVERFHFSDLNLAFDLDGHAGTTARLLGAVFGQESVGNAGYVGIGLRLLDRGMDDETLAELAIEQALGRMADHGDVVELLYENVVGHAPSVAESSPFVRLLEKGVFSHGGLALAAAETAVNEANIDLVGLAENGLQFMHGE